MFLRQGKRSDDIFEEISEVQLNNLEYSNPWLFTESMSVLSCINKRFTAVSGKPNTITMTLTNHMRQELSKFRSNYMKFTQSAGKLGEQGATGWSWFIFSLVHPLTPKI